MEALVRIYSTGEVKTISKSTGEFITQYCGNITKLHDILDNMSRFVDPAEAPKLTKVDVTMNVITDHPISFPIPLTHVKELLNYIVKPIYESDKPQ